MLFSILNSILYAVLIVQLCNSQQCMTKKPQLCIFPFKYQNKTYTGCKTDEDKPEKLWCSTKVDEEGRHIEGGGGVTWGYCSNECPMEGDQECEETRQCVNGLECPEFREFKKMPKNRPDYQVEKNKWVGRICNKKEKRLCCLRPIQVRHGPIEPQIITPPQLGDQECEETRQCVNGLECPEFREFKKMPKNRPDYQEEKNKWVGRICNKKEKRLCCLRPIQVRHGPIEPQIITPPQTIPPPAARKPTTATSPTETNVCDGGQEYTGKILPPLGQCGKYCSTSRIFGGVNAGLGEFPWAALLGYKIIKKVQQYPKQIWVKKRFTVFRCGGTLINTRYVLTAAHCHNSANNISSVVLGEWQVGKDPDCPEGSKDRSSCKPKRQKVRVESVTVHEGYKKDKTNGEVVNDIALIRLKKPVVLNEAVQPICLPLNEENIIEEIGIGNLEEGIIGRDATIIGWGATKNFLTKNTDCQGVPHCILQKVDIPIISNENCQSRLSDISTNSTIRSSHICAFDDETKNKDSCKGDSGGGMFISKNSDDKTDDTYYQVGIVSYGVSGFCGIGYPGVYTRITEFMQWIKENLRD